MAKQAKGGCACGRVCYRLASGPMITHACHCSFCQRETGSAFAVNMLYERDRVELVGEPEEILTPSASGKGQRVLRCPECHVAVSSHYPGGGDNLHFIRAGTLDDRSGVAPDVHIYTATRQQWFDLPADVPAFEGFYDPAKLWSPETTARWQKAKAR